MPRIITKFRGEYFFLSNFHPCIVWLDGSMYPSVEHAYQAAKFTSPKKRQQICNAGTAAEAKRLSRKIGATYSWTDSYAITLMLRLLSQKFYRDINPVMHRLLLETGDAKLVEGNTWGDKFWGMCDGEGNNYLGRCLMRVRHSVAKRKDVYDYEAEVKGATSV